MQIQRYSIPWFVVILIEEITLIILACTNIGNTIEEFRKEAEANEDTEMSPFGEMFSIKGAFIIVNFTLTAIRFFVFWHIARTCWRSKYQQF